MSLKRLLLSVAAGSLLAGPVFADGGPTPEPPPPPPPAPAAEPAPPPPESAAFEPSFYVEGEGGAAFAGNLSYGSGSFQTDTGYNFGGAMGMHMSPNWDVEVDVFYAKVGYSCCNTDISGLSTMLDALYNFDTGWFANPYVGAGIGLTRVRYDGGDQFPLFTGSQWKFGYQIMAGLMAELTESTGLFVEYRFHDVAGDAEIAGVGNIAYQTHNVSAGLQFTF